MRISVVIPNWNGARFLPTCLDSLRKQTQPSDDVIVVDNGSQDGSLELLRERYPEVRVISWPDNQGFAVAVNAGIRAASGDAVALLNNDTECDPAWLSELNRAAEEHPEAGFFASKLLLFDRRTVIHTAGDFFGTNGLPGNRGVWGEDHGQFDEMVDIFSACAGAALYRKAMLDEIGLFDESLGSYCEDVDLSFRAQLAGYRCRFVPTARVYHRISATGGGPLSSYYTGRNFLLVLAKNMPGPLLRRHAPSIIATQLSLVWESLWHIREPAARARLRGQFAGLRSINSTRPARREIQSRRKASDDYIESILTTPEERKQWTSK
jgi:GT2 family glycosyltransferase